MRPLAISTNGSLSFASHLTSCECLGVLESQEPDYIVLFCVSQTETSLYIDIAEMREAEQLEDIRKKFSQLEQ